MSDYKCPRYKRAVTIVPVEDRPLHPGILLYDHQRAVTALTISRELLENSRDEYFMHQHFSSLEAQLVRHCEKHGQNLQIVGEKPSLDRMYDWHVWYADNGSVAEQLHKLFRGRSKAFQIVAGLAPTTNHPYRHHVSIEWAMLTFPDIGDLGLAKLSLKWL